MFDVFGNEILAGKYVTYADIDARGYAVMDIYLVTHVDTVAGVVQGACVVGELADPYAVVDWYLCEPEKRSCVLDGSLWSRSKFTQHSAVH